MKVSITKLNSEKIILLYGDVNDRYTDYCMYISER